MFHSKTNYVPHSCECFFQIYPFSVIQRCILCLTQLCEYFIQKSILPHTAVECFIQRSILPHIAVCFIQKSFSASHLWSFSFKNPLSVSDLWSVSFKDPLSVSDLWSVSFKDPFSPTHSCAVFHSKTHFLPHSCEVFHSKIHFNHTELCSILFKEPSSIFVSGTELSVQQQMKVMQQNVISIMWTKLEVIYADCKVWKKCIKTCCHDQACFRRVASFWL